MESTQWFPEELCQHTRRPECSNCQRPCRVCICDSFPKEKLTSSTQIYILQHPSESHSAFRTVPILEHCLENVTVYPCTKIPAEWTCSSIYSKGLLLFPTESAVSVSQMPRGSYVLYVIDGTWSSAKKMLQKNTILQQLNAITLEEPNSQLPFGKVPLFWLRKPPKNIPSAYCTAEAVARTLYSLEEKETNGMRIYQTIRNCIIQFCEKQMKYISVESVRHRRQHEGYLAGLYEAWQREYLSDNN
eukprot:jgi/Galph1/3090/GphlegSOOS_G1736.1